MAEQKRPVNQPERQGQNREPGSGRPDDPTREREGQRGTEREQERKRTDTDRDTGTERDKSIDTETGTGNIPEGDVEGIGQSRR